MQGDGFYTSAGLPDPKYPSEKIITFKIDPNARNGSDFLLVKVNAETIYLVFRNGSKVKNIFLCFILRSINN